MSKEAMKLALEALNSGVQTRANRIDWIEYDSLLVEKAIAALREAMAEQPPQRTWVHLTNQEHDEIAIDAGCMSADWVFYGAAVERKLREKNT